MNREDVERITDLLIEIGGRRAWVLLWDEPEAEKASVLTSVPSADLPELVCFHLLRLIRNELGPDDTIAREH